MDIFRLDNEGRIVQAEGESSPNVSVQGRKFSLSIIQSKTQTRD